MTFIARFGLLFILAAVVMATPEPDQRQARGVHEGKLRFDEDKKDVSNFLNTKNIIRTLVKLFLGNSEESTATSRQVLSVLVKVLDMVRTSFTTRARSVGGNGVIKDTLEDATGAGTSMLKGYVQSLLSTDKQCALRHICEASKDAVRDGGEVGRIVAQAGAFASKMFLDKDPNGLHIGREEAARRGRAGEDCAKQYAPCVETQ
ncbi:hypothetical protein HDE_12282 [Halotydeus destructor]|nr:hypothetical protein HDE_12282 [Halotydeus destructor]